MVLEYMVRIGAVEVVIVTSLYSFAKIFPTSRKYGKSAALISFLLRNLISLYPLYKLFKTIVFQVSLDTPGRNVYTYLI